MVRPLRLTYEGAVYHVTARGNDRGSLFKTHRDRERYLMVLAESLQRYDVRLYLYCLMTNHGESIGAWPKLITFPLTMPANVLSVFSKTKRITGATHVVLNETTYTALGQVATARGPYPKNPTQAQLDINYTQYTYDDLDRPWKEINKGQTLFIRFHG